MRRPHHHHHRRRRLHRTSKHWTHLCPLRLPPRHPHLNSDSGRGYKQALARRPSRTTRLETRQKGSSSLVCSMATCPVGRLLLTIVKWFRLQKHLPHIRNRLLLLKNYLRWSRQMRWLWKSPRKCSTTQSDSIIWKRKFKQWFRHRHHLKKRPKVLLWLPLIKSCSNMW